VLFCTLFFLPQYSFRRQAYGCGLEGMLGLEPGGDATVVGAGAAAGLAEAIGPV
jgi:hypothetical protein